MSNELFWDILDEKRKEILPLLDSFKTDFYLAGGTAIALQIGHRDSIDFDFFSDKEFLTNELYKKIEKTFGTHKILKIQDEKDTLTVLIDNTVKISFFTYPYKLMKPLITTAYFNIAEINDIGCMKLSAITSRSQEKDFIDLYFILQKISFSELLNLTKEKFPSLDINLILKSLVYFDDITPEPIAYKHNHQTDFALIKRFLENQVKEYFS